MKIAITGVPGTGKTEVSKVLAKKLNYKLIRIDDLAEKLNAFIGYDEERECKILDMEKLKEEVKKIKENTILEGHVSHLLSVDLIIILRCNPEVLKKRLERRYPDKPLKVKENVEAEILGVITSEAIMENENVYEIDTTNKKPEQVVSEILKILEGKGNEFKVGKIDWLEKYADLIDLKTEL